METSPLRSRRPKSARRRIIVQGIRLHLSSGDLTPDKSHNRTCGFGPISLVRFPRYTPKWIFPSARDPQRGCIIMGQAGRSEVSMRRPLCTILASFVLASNLLETQDCKSQSSESTSGADAAILRLLQQSHDLGQQLPVSSRLMNLLPRQVEMVSRLRPDLGREWANELFTLSFQTKGAQRSFVQNTAMLILIRLDPDRALELLHSLNIEEPVAKWATSPPEMQLVHEVFTVLVVRDGASALPLLGQEAERLGVLGHYPYAALGYAAMQAT